MCVSLETGSELPMPESELPMPYVVFFIFLSNSERTQCLHFVEIVDHQCLNFSL